MIRGVEIPRERHLSTTASSARGSEPQFARLIESVTEYALFTLDETGTVVSWNEGANRTFGYSSAAIIGKNFTILFTPGDIAAGLPANELALALEKGRYDRDCWHVRANKSRFWATNTVQPMYDGGRLIGFVKIVRDMTERYLADEALRASDERFRLLTDYISDYAIFSLSARFEVTAWNDGAKHLFGYGATEIVGSSILRLLPTEEPDGTSKPNGSQVLRDGLPDEGTWYTRKDNTRFFATSRRIPLATDEFGTDRGSVLIVHDISDQKFHVESMRHKAFYDKLTGLPNRASLFERVANAKVTWHDGSRFGVLFVDLDHFKEVNDSVGHAAADRHLHEIARRLERAVRPNDIVARLGGDEFALLLANVDSAEAAGEVAGRIRAALAEPFDSGHGATSVTASIGVAFCSQVDRFEQALHEADVAMYEAKSAGRNQFVLYDEGMRGEGASGHLPETEISRAIRRKEFFAQYQPIVDAATRSIVGFEALVRWRHPLRGILLPSAFIPAAERADLIRPIDLWLLEVAARQLSEWQRDPARSGLTMSVNFSTKGLASPETVAAIRKILRGRIMTPGSLRIEITESVLLETSDQVVDALAGLRALGIEFYLDDFGTGYSGLNYLRRSGATTLKIDRSFVTGMAKNEGNAELVHAIVGLAHTLRLKAIAEGIESEEELEMLRAWGCDYGQGHLFGRALDAEAALALLAKKPSRRPPVMRRSTAPL